ncbi:MFS transporter, DHA1 family, bicyclomycin/chloramphenicol resistance protein [Gemmobacter megaterium]|uniref:Bcr/CflA family efflux transporter n=1 Tax=Gemmobacter megaterium TaxID=1086013 RepID=A0A1N7P816_9RHOB|nr:multidrug effflux MFS transporter [Gemmobacter megaterium]GGE19936.1 Bcr/CflA family drug resistance efflux transporter [Gemmobacter megaterium]SIT06785.1 MFS transporter, DHA1 family, bicyclomycin/chloramphenicol resistance protein [Gemmobacter megaterium]
MTRAAPQFLNRRTPPHLITLILMAALSAMTMNIFLPSLPAIAAWYGTSYGTAQLSVSLYLGLSGALQLFIGPLADRYGRRPVTLVACVIFLLATLGILFAPTIEVFLFFRMVQAAVATGMVLSRAIVRDMVPEAEAASMIGWVTMGMSLVPMFAPAIGGWLDQLLGWQANFVLLLVLGALITAMLWADLGETSVRRPTSLMEQVRSYPTLLTSWRFWGYAISASAGSGTFFSFLGGAPAVGTQVFGMSPAELGLYFAAPGIGYMAGNYLSARLAMRLGIMRMVVYGTVVLCIPLAVMLFLALSGQLTPLGFFGMMSLVGLGNGMSLPSANAGMMSVRPDLVGSASGLGGALMIGGGAALSALAAVVMGDGTSALPLIVLMWASAMVALAAALVVVARNRKLGL